jgi:anti-sigma regulatory factor (Ser/Thr protein kinase)
MDSTSLARRFRASADQVGQARREATAFARRRGVVDPDAVALALSEAITNVVLHAYVDAAEPGEVELVARDLADDGLMISVCDDGRGMTPRPDSPGLGLGLPLLAALTERFEVQSRPGGGTRLCLFFATAS